MKWLRVMCLAVVAGQLMGSGTGPSKTPPVLKTSDPPDSVQVTLPGPPPVTPHMILGVPPVATRAPLPRKLAPAATAAAPVKPSIPAELLGDVSVYCKKQIGHWKETDAREVLGKPLRHRPAYDEQHVVNGAIYTFADPAKNYKELELDFDLKSGSLRTVFLYPPRLTWDECQRRWTGPVTAADAAQGRKFYSYTKRRLDVLVDSTGKVISLGWY